MNDSSGYYTPQSNSLDFVTPTDEMVQKMQTC